MNLLFKKPGKPSMTFELYKDKKSQFRWRLLAANGNNVCSSSEAYTTKHNCMKSIKAVKIGAIPASIKDLTKKSKK